MSWPELDRASKNLLLSDLITSPLRAAELVAALSLAVDQERIDDLSPDQLLAMDSALGTMGRQCILSEPDSIQGVNIEEVNTEALALARYFSLDSSPTSPLVSAESFAPGLIEDALREGSFLREENRRLMTENKALGRARSVIGIAVLAVILAVFILFEESGRIEIAIIMTVTLLLASGFLLRWIGLAPNWLLEAGRLLVSGYEGIHERLDGALRSEGDKS